MLAWCVAKGQGWGLYMGDQSLVIPPYQKYLCQAYPIEKEWVPGERAGSHPRFCSLPEQVRGHKKRIGINPPGVGHYFYFSSSSARKNCTGNSQRRNGVASWHLLSFRDMFLRVPSGQGQTYPYPASFHYLGRRRTGARGKAMMLK